MSSQSAIFNSNFVWFAWLERLANVLNCSVQQIYKITALEMLNWMVYIKEKDLNAKGN